MDMTTATPQAVHESVVKKDETTGQAVLGDVSCSTTSVQPALRNLCKEISSARFLGELMDGPRSFQDLSYQIIKAMGNAGYHRRIQIGDYFRTK